MSDIFLYCVSLQTEPPISLGAGPSTSPAPLMGVGRGGGGVTVEITEASRPASPPTPTLPHKDRAIAYGLCRPFFLPSPRRKPGSRATSTLLQPWIPAFAGMTNRKMKRRRPNAIAL